MGDQCNRRPRIHQAARRQPPCRHCRPSRPRLAKATLRVLLISPPPHRPLRRLPRNGQDQTRRRCTFQLPFQVKEPMANTGLRTKTRQHPGPHIQLRPTPRHRFLQHPPKEFKIRRGSSRRRPNHPKQGKE